MSGQHSFSSSSPASSATPSPPKAISARSEASIGDAMHFNLQPATPTSGTAKKTATRISGMHITQLNICAVLENVTDLRLRDEKEPLYVKLKCDKCEAISAKSMAISAHNRLSIMGGRSYVNYVYRCAVCERNAHLILLDSAPGQKQQPYTLCDSTEFRTLVELECRGATPVAFEVDKSTFRCKSTKSKLEFDDVELIDRSWADYDEIAGVSVGVYDVHYRLHSYVVKK